jgi:ABC-type lipoprotein release transport system permease subunit
MVSLLNDLRITVHGLRNASGFSAITILGVQPTLGRAFLPEEVGTSGVSAIVVGHDYWQSRLGGRRDLSEATVRVGEGIHVVVGVAASWIPAARAAAVQPTRALKSE